MRYSWQQTLLTAIIVCLLVVTAYWGWILLKGTGRLLLEVDVASVAREKVERLRARAIKGLHDLGVVPEQVPATQGLTVEFRLREESDFQVVLAKLNEMLRDGLSARNRFDMAPDVGRVIRITIADDALTEEVKWATDESIKVIRHRLREFGTDASTIARSDDQRVAVDLPGTSNWGRLVKLLDRRAKLTFHLIDTSVPLEQALKGGPDAKTAVLYGPEEQGCKPYVVRTDVQISTEPKALKISGDAPPPVSEFLVDARPVVDPSTKEAAVVLRLNVLGAFRLSQVLQDNKGSSLAVALDNTVIATPAIDASIIGGSILISGNLNPESANDLAILLRANPMPAPLNVIERPDAGPRARGCATRTASVGAVAR